MLEGERQHPSIPLLQGLVALWVYEVNYGDTAQAAALLDEFYFFHDALRLSDLSIPANNSSTPSWDFQLATEWQIISCITWGFFYLDA